MRNSKRDGSESGGDLHTINIDPNATIRSNRDSHHHPSPTHANRHGKLKMSDVRNLSDDADQVIDTLKGVDYGA